VYTETLHVLTAKLVHKAKWAKQHSQSAKQQISPALRSICHDKQCGCACAEMPGVLTAKLVSRASRLSSKASVEAAAASRLQGALAGQDDNPLFLGGIRVPPAETITDAMGAAIATGIALFRKQDYAFWHGGKEKVPGVRYIGPRGFQPDFSSRILWA
jgi:hypothetical protein